MTLPGVLALWAAFAVAPQEQPDSVVHVRAARTEDAPVLDGALGAAEWAAADPVASFIQYQPSRGRPSTRRTEVRVMYDSTHVYFAMRAWDGEPVTAQLTRRDADLAQDDFFAVILDTYLDGQSGYLFAVNPLGKL